MCFVLISRYHDKHYYSVFNVPQSQCVTVLYTCSHQNLFQVEPIRAHCWTDWSSPGTLVISHQVTCCWALTKCCRWIRTCQKKNRNRLTQIIFTPIKFKFMTPVKCDKSLSHLKPTSFTHTGNNNSPCGVCWVQNFPCELSIIIFLSMGQTSIT